jgi:hypothetical protein
LIFTIPAASKPEKAPDSEADAKNVATLMDDNENKMHCSQLENQNEPDLQSISGIEE